jgi:hypothetical protein
LLAAGCILKKHQLWKAADEKQLLDLDAALKLIDESDYIQKFQEKWKNLIQTKKDFFELSCLIRNRGASDGDWTKHIIIYFMKAGKLFCSYGRPHGAQAGNNTTGGYFKKGYQSSGVEYRIDEIEWFFLTEKKNKTDITNIMAEIAQYKLKLELDVSVEPEEEDEDFGTTIQKLSTDLSTLPPKEEKQNPIDLITEFQQKLAKSLARAAKKRQLISPANSSLASDVYIRVPSIRIEKNWRNYKGSNSQLTKGLGFRKQLGV